MPSAIEEAAEPRPLKPISSKSVLIAEPESIAPGLSPNIRHIDGNQPSRHSFSSKQHSTNTSRRLAGRPAPDVNSPPLDSISSLSSIGPMSTLEPPNYGDKSGSDPKLHHHVRHHDHASHIVSQVAEWLHNEKTKRAARKTRRHGAHAGLAHAAKATKGLVDQMRSDESKRHIAGRGRAGSDLSEGSLALEKLEQILSQSISIEEDGAATPLEDMKVSYFPRPRRDARQGSKRLLRKASTIQSSDTEYQEPDIDVPSAEVVLDNSKTLGYGGSVPTSESDLLNPKTRAIKEKEAWQQFKQEIIRLAHTLRLKGWTRIPLDRGEDIDVERLSGALTNAVYVVSPPSNLVQNPSIADGSTTSLVPKRPPPKLLLRIYGPQVEHLIDRGSELQILRRLARKKIGPRLLGTFCNGRFEQFFQARTLTARDLRIPETSKQIAKRMRELHDGIELLEEEREGGAFVWRNWDKWKDRCEEVISYLDDQILKGKSRPTRTCSEGWKKRGLVCGVEFTVFRQAVRKYRDWLEEQYGGSAGIRQKLVFAHNDTQYGNLLRLDPSGESPLLLPANEHKQLIVIDFEYASANVPGLEFANHFTEWCYDYHSSSKPYGLNASRYPTPKEQHRFLKAYVQHRPPFQVRTPAISYAPGPTSSVSHFMLDSRAPPAQIAEEQKQRDEILDSEIKRLSLETRLWRIANSAQWVAWGIVQAKVPRMVEALEAAKAKGSTPQAGETRNLDHHPQGHLGTDAPSLEMEGLVEDAQNKRPDVCEGTAKDHQDDEEEEEEEEGFDYLGYAQERAMLFWGDMLQLGLVKREELPEALLEKAKFVEY